MFSIVPGVSRYLNQWFFVNKVSGCGPSHCIILSYYLSLLCLSGILQLRFNPDMFNFPSHRLSIILGIMQCQLWNFSMTNTAPTCWTKSTLKLSPATSMRKADWLVHTRRYQPTNHLCASTSPWLFGTKLEGVPGGVKFFYQPHVNKDFFHGCSKLDATQAIFSSILQIWHHWSI